MMGLFGKFWRDRDVSSAIEGVLDTKLRETVTAINSVGVLTEEKRALTEFVHKLELKVDSLQEKIAREREQMKREAASVREKLRQEQMAMKHAHGLQQQRVAQEAELLGADLAAKEKRLEFLTTLAVKEARLSAQTEASEEAREQMTAFLDRQEGMISMLLDSLPSAKIFKREGGPDVEVTAK